MAERDDAVTADGAVGEWPQLGAPGRFAVVPVERASGPSWGLTAEPHRTQLRRCHPGQVPLGRCGPGSPEASSPTA